MKNLLLVFAVISSFTLAKTLNAQKMPSADEVIKNYFEVTGGYENWGKLKSMQMLGDMNMGGMKFKGKVTNSAPNKMRIDIDVQGMAIVMSYDGTKAWGINPFQGGTDPQELSKEESEDFTDNEFPSAMYDYSKKGHKAEILGTQNIEGAKCYELKLSKANGNEEFHYFDVETGVLIMSKTFSKSGPMEGAETQTFFSDYQEVGAYMMPYSTSTKVDGEVFQVITATEFKLDPEIPAEFFSMPE